MVDLWVPIVMFLSIFGGVATWLYFRAKTRTEQQLTLRKAIDQGQSLSEDMVQALTGELKRSPFADLRRGLILLAIALSVLGFGWLQDDDDASVVLYGVALFPLLLSFAYLAMHKLGLNRVS